MKLIVAILAGAVLGVVGARYLFVGSWLSLVPWGIAGLAIGFWGGKMQARWNGAVYGFVVSLAFLIAGYGGSAPLITRVPFFAALALFGAACGLVLGLAGFWVRGRVRMVQR